MVTEALALLEGSGYTPYLIDTDDPGDLDALPHPRAYTCSALTEVGHSNLFLSKDLRIDVEIE